MRLQVSSLALLSGLRIQHCSELWSRSQMQLQSYLDPYPENFHMLRVRRYKAKKKKKKVVSQENFGLLTEKSQIQVL